MSSIVALDTNVVSRILSGDNEILSKLDNVSTYFIPLTVYAELLSGLKAGSNPNRYVPILQEFLNQNYILLNTEINAQTVKIYAVIYSHLKKNGTPVSPNDIWIAAECNQNAYPLFTLDKDFTNIPQVILF